MTEERDALTLFLCGDVMTGRGIDQLAAARQASPLRELRHDARDYLRLAEAAHPRSVAPATA